MSIIPIKKALQGVPTHRREITWITQDRTYEDITTVMPIKVGSEVESALVMSMSIEDLKTTIAHATGYSSRYSLYSMVGETSDFWLCSIKLRVLPAAIIISCFRRAGYRQAAFGPWYPPGQSACGCTVDRCEVFECADRGVGRRIFRQCRR